MSITGLQVIELISRAKMTGEQRQRHKNCQKWIKKAGHVTQKNPVLENKTFLPANANKGSCKRVPACPKAASARMTGPKRRLVPGHNTPTHGVRRQRR